MSELQTKLGPTRQQWVLLFVLIGALIGLGLFARFQGGGSDIQWRDDFEAARAEASETGRPLLLYFTADWCEPCQRMKKRVWPKDSVERAVNERTIPVYLDIDTERVKVIAKHYPVQFIPTLIFADAEGRPLTKDGHLLGHDQYTAANHLLSMVEAAQSATPMADGEFVLPGDGETPAPERGIEDGSPDAGASTSR